MVPIIISIPSLIRLRQCLIEYLRVRNNPNRTASAGWGGQHLANALKYSSAFPVIILSAMQRGTNPNDFGMSEAGLFRLWYLLPSVRHDSRLIAEYQAIFRLPQLILFFLLGRC